MNRYKVTTNAYGHYLVADTHGVCEEVGIYHRRSDAKRQADKLNQLEDTRDERHTKALEQRARFYMIFGGAA